MKEKQLFPHLSQPWRVLYTLSSVVSLLFFRLPYRSLVSLIPSNRPRPTWTFKRTMIVYTLHAFIDLIFDVGFFPGVIPDTSKEPKLKDTDKLSFVWMSPLAEAQIASEVSELAKRNKVEVATRVGGYWYGARGEDGKRGQRAGQDEKVLLFFHSGGYTVDTGGIGALGACETVLSGLMSKRLPFDRILSSEYRLTSSAPYKAANAYPAALIDAIASYSYLISLGFEPRNIFVAGDSSGGHLAFALAYYLVKYPEAGMAAPGGLLLLSPTLDFSVSSIGPDSSWEKNQTTDFCFSIFESRYTVTSLRGEMSEEEFSADPLCCPGSLNVREPKGLFKRLPKTLLVASGAELNVDAMRTFKERMLADVGSDGLQYVEMEDATHDVLAYAWHEPERAEVLDIVEKWFGQF